MSPLVTPGALQCCQPRGGGECTLHPLHLSLALTVALGASQGYRLRIRGIGGALFASLPRVRVTAGAGGGLPPHPSTATRCPTPLQWPCCRA